MKRRRRASAHRIKSLRSYTVEEAAEVIGVHKHNVRLWFKSGLEAIDTRRPTLILGGALIAFLSLRQAERKRPCPAGHIYCLGCGSPRQPDPALVDYAPAIAGTGNIKAICPVCAELMNRRASAGRYEAFRRELAGTTMQGESRIGDCPTRRLNLDFGGANE